MGVLNTTIQGINFEEKFNTKNTDPIVPIVVGRGKETSKETKPVKLKPYPITPAEEARIEEANEPVVEETPNTKPIAEVEPAVKQSRPVTTVEEVPNSADKQLNSSTEQSSSGDWREYLKSESDRHNEAYKQEFASWKNALDEVTSQGKNLYKADPRLADIKRREGMWKTLAVAMGSIADTFAVANGGTAPLRDHRADVYSSYAKADAIDQSERAKETQAHQKYVDQLNAVLGRKPKHTQDAALLAKAGYLAGIEKTNLNARNAVDLLNKKLAAQKEIADAQIKGKNKVAKTKAEEKAKGGALKQKDYAMPFARGKTLIIPTSFYRDNSGAIEDDIVKNIKSSGDKTKIEELAANLKDLKNAMGNKDGGAAAIGQFISRYNKWISDDWMERLISKSIDPANAPWLSKEAVKSIYKEWGIVPKTIPISSSPEEQNTEEKKADIEYE